MMFHEDPKNTGSKTLGPRLKAQDHLLDPLHPTIVYTCCVLAKDKGMPKHDCDRYRIYYVRREVAKRYMEYMKSGALTVRCGHKRGL
jgi:hypothetical protein